MVYNEVSEIQSAFRQDICCQRVKSCVDLILCILRSLKHL